MKNLTEITDFKSYFDKYVKKEFINFNCKNLNKSRGQRTKNRLEVVLVAIKAVHDAGLLEKNEGDSFIETLFDKHGAGYELISTSGIRSGLRTKASYSFSKEVHDHLFGATTIGNTIIQEFKDSGYNMDYMLNEWLFDNLYLWMSIRVSEIEHQKDNIIRDTSMNISDRMKLKHYKNVSPIVIHEEYKKVLKEQLS